MIDAVIFDLDNTLMDFMKMKSMSIDAAINGMIEAGMDIEVDKSRKEIYSIYDKKGYEYQEVFDDFILTSCGVLKHKYLAAAIVSYRKIKDATLVMYPNVNSTLIKLSKLGMLLGVVTDAPSREAWIRIFSLNMHHIFDKVVTFDDTGFYKPAKEPFIKIVKKLGIDYSDCLMVGDWPERDIKGAKQFGMKTAYAKYGCTEYIDNSGADYELDTIHELIEIIRTENDIL